MALSKTERSCFQGAGEKKKELFMLFHAPGLSPAKTTRSFWELLITAPGKAASGATYGPHPIVLITFLLLGFAPRTPQSPDLKGRQRPDDTQRSRRHGALHAMELHLVELGESAHPGMVPLSPLSYQLGLLLCSTATPRQGPCSMAVGFPGGTEQASPDSRRVSWQTPADNKKPCVAPARLPHHTGLTAWRLSPRWAKPAGQDRAAPAHLGPPPPRTAPGPPPSPAPPRL